MNWKPSDMAEILPHNVFSSRTDHCVPATDLFFIGSASANRRHAIYNLLKAENRRR